MDKNKLAVILVWFVDILWIWIFIPTLPDLTVYYSVSAHSISYAIVLYALFSFLFWPILWQLSDRFWRKKILLLCIIWSFISSFMMSISTLFIVFLLGRIINGASGGNISILQSMLSDISKTKEERMHNMWLLAGLFWLGFIVWPIIWSLLLPYWVKAPFWFMTFLSLIEIFMILYLLKETNNHIVATKKININPFSTINKYLQNKEISIFLISFFLLMFSFSLYQGMFPVFLSKHFDVPGYVAGYVMSWIWLFIALNQMVLLKHFWLKYFSLKSLFYIANIWIFIVFTILSFINNIFIFLPIFYCLVFFQWIVNPIYSSEIVQNAHLENRWEIMWVLSSLGAMTMFMWPLIGGILIDKDISMFIFWSFIVFVNILLVTKLVKKLQ